MFYSRERLPTSHHQQRHWQQRDVAFGDSGLHLVSPCWLLQGGKVGQLRETVKFAARQIERAARDFQVKHRWNMLGIVEWKLMNVRERSAATIMSGARMEERA